MSRLSTQAPSQRTSVGQARAQLPPKTLASRIVRAAPSSSRWAIWRMNLGTSIEVGQARESGEQKQYRQRSASAKASSRSRGGGRSAKLAAIWLGERRPAALGMKTLRQVID